MGKEKVKAIKKDEEIEEEEDSEEDEDFEAESGNSGSNSGSEEEEEEDEEEEFQVKEEEEESKINNKKRPGQTNMEEMDVAEKKKVKTEEGEEGDDEEGGVKWKYLEHHGVLFPDYWKRHDVRIKYNGQPLELTTKQEELATYWAQTLGTEYENRDIYRKNFIAEWMKSFKGQKEYSDFEKFDFWSIKSYLEEEKEKRKNRSKEEKNQLKSVQAEKDKYYGYALIDGDREKIGGYLIEPPTLFKGRGEHPKAGLMKARIMPEQLTINIAEDAPVPKCTMPGHCWKEIVHKNDVTWLGGYKDDTIKKTHKYIQMAATSKFKYMNDMKKYERARRLKKMVDHIRQDYEKKMERGTEKEKQLGTATYLIDHLALRVGNEKGEDEADTVGCCSLRVEHITIEDDGDKITFDFLGKDSMRYHNTVQVTPLAWKNMKSFTKGKKGREDLFDRIQASDLNEYLKNFMDDLSAKVFRTYNASHTLQEQLDKFQNVKDGAKWKPDQKAAFYDNAVKQVAILCNHQKTVSKNFNVQTEKLYSQLKEYEKYLEELKDYIKKFKGQKAPKKKDEEIILEKKDNGKDKILQKKFPESKDKAQSELTKLQANIQKQKEKLEQRESNKDIALGTSKTNYNDPRVTVSWCKSSEQPIEKCFPKTLRDKFLWAMNVEPEWKF